MQNTAEIKISIGTLCDGTPVSTDLKKLPHLLIAGEGAGAYLTALITGAAKDHSPEALRVLAVNNGAISSLPHLLFPVIEDEKTAEEALLWLKDECDRRFALFAAAGTRNIDSYNEKAEAKLFYVVAAISELERLTKRAKEYTAMLAAKARAAGIYLVVCTEKPDNRVITGIIKANVPSHIALKTETKAQSRLILDTAGAERLEENELLFYPISNRMPELLCYSLPKEAELEDTLSEIAEKYPRAEFVCISVAEKKPSLLLQSLEAMLNYGTVSNALLQRALHIGYARAAKLISEMETAGYIGEYRGSKPREILLSKSELADLINKLREN